MPVFKTMVCDFEDWVAWVSPFWKREGSVVEGKAPPSRLRASFIEVSLVSRDIAAERTVGDKDDIF